MTKRCLSRGGTGRLLRVAATSALVSVLGGCSLAFSPPTVRVAEVRLASLDFVRGTLVVALHVENPNRYALESREFRYALAFADEAEGGEGWTTLAEGEVTEPVRVEGGATGSIEVAVPFDVASVGAAMGRLLRRGELEYRFSGALRAGTPLGVKTIPFDQRGVFRP